MLVRSRRAAAFAIGAVLFALATACTNPTAPGATPRNAVRGASGDGVTTGSSNAKTAMCGVTTGSSNCG